MQDNNPFAPQQPTRPEPQQPAQPQGYPQPQMQPQQQLQQQPVQPQAPYDFSLPQTPQKPKGPNLLRVIIIAIIALLVLTGGGVAAVLLTRQKAPESTQESQTDQTSSGAQGTTESPQGQIADPNAEPGSEVPTGSDSSYAILELEVSGALGRADREAYAVRVTQADDSVHSIGLTATRVFTSAPVSQYALKAALEALRDRGFQTVTITASTPLKDAIKDLGATQAIVGTPTDKKATFDIDKAATFLS